MDQRAGPYVATVALLLAAALMAPYAAAQSPAATQQDVLDSQTAIVAAMNGQFSNMTAKINNVTAKLTLLTATLTTMQGKLANVTATNAQDAIALASVRANVTALLTQVTLLRNETLSDHVTLHKDLVGTDGHAILPVVAAQQTDIAQKQATISLSQDELGQQYLGVRADLTDLASNLTTGLQNSNDGNQQAFQQGDVLAGKATLATNLLIVVVIMQVILTSAMLKFPRRLWDRLGYEAKRTERRGQFIDPPCPKAADGLRFGDHFQCPIKDKCKVGQACRIKAVQLTEAQAKGDKSTEELTKPVPNGNGHVEVEPPEEEEADAEEIPVVQVRPLTQGNGTVRKLDGFGR